MKTWMWFLLLLLVGQCDADMVMLRMYTRAGTTHETFPLLAHTLQYWGMDVSIWVVRALIHIFLFAVPTFVRNVPRSLPYVCYFLVAFNLCYAAGLTDVPFAFHWWGL